MYIPLGERELAEQLEQKGRLEGEQKGKEEMVREMARNLLKSGVSPDIIAQSASMPVEHILSLVN